MESLLVSSVQAIESVRFVHQDRIDRDQFDIEVPKQFECAVKARLVSHPADQVGQSVFATTDLKSVDGRYQRRTQSASDNDFEAPCTQDGPFPPLRGTAR
jgi:hypothetical protein